MRHFIPKRRCPTQAQLCRGRRRATPTEACPSRLIRDRVAEQADAVDFDLDHVAGLHPERRIALGAHASRCPCHDHVADLKAA